MSSSGRPRRAATSSGRTRPFSAATVACTILIGLSEPRDFDNTSWIPAHSSTARTGPPAMTPVPGLAGFSRTTPAAASPCTGCGMVCWIRGTLKKFFLASSTPFAITDDDQRGEAEPPATLDDLGDAVDRHNPLEMWALLRRAPVPAAPTTLS